MICCEGCGITSETYGKIFGSIELQGKSFMLCSDCERKLMGIIEGGWL